MFAVISAPGVQDNLRGYIGRYLQEVSAGLFVGRLSPVVWAKLWERIEEERSSGQVVGVVSAPTECGYKLHLAGCDALEVVDFDGFPLSARVQNRSSGSVLPA